LDHFTKAGKRGSDAMCWLDHRTFHLCRLVQNSRKCFIELNIDLSQLELVFGVGARKDWIDMNKVLLHAGADGSRVGRRNFQRFQPASRILTRLNVANGVRDPCRGLDERFVGEPYDDGIENERKAGEREENGELDFHT